MSKIEPCFVLQQSLLKCGGPLPLSMQITGIDEGLTVKQVCIDFLDKVFLRTYEPDSKTVSIEIIP